MGYKSWQNIGEWRRFNEEQIIISAAHRRVQCLRTAVVGGNWYQPDSGLELPAFAVGRQLIRLGARVWQIWRREKGSRSPGLQDDDVKHMLLKCSEMETGERNLCAVSGSMWKKMQLTGIFKSEQMWQTLRCAAQYFTTTVVSEELSRRDTKPYTSLLEFCADCTLLVSQGHALSNFWVFNWRSNWEESGEIQKPKYSDDKYIRHYWRQ